MLPAIFGENLFDEMFDDMMRPMHSMEKALYGKHARAIMKTDVRETDNSYEVDIDLPGFKKDDIHLELDGDTLTVSAERHSDWEDEEKKGGFVRCERSFGQYSRSFDVSGVDTSKIEASYEDGVLKLTLPKKQETVPASRRIEIR